VLDTVLKLPASVHYQSGNGKAILKALSRRYLPESAWNRPKHGFSVPIRQLLQTAWRELGDDLISRAQDLAPWLNLRSVRRLWLESREGRGYPALMYSLLVLLLWLDLRKG
ncbi:MAG: hypothetical protein FGM18_09275, partial [Burkholderiaceae bacterium]|nr:hypothetical protein [Burkholderiaceae bacterium]